MNSNLTDYQYQVESGVNHKNGGDQISFGYFFLNFISDQFRVVFALCLGLLFFCGNIVAQTDFAPGEIMFTGYNSTTTDAFSIVLLTNVVSSTVIYITDRGWSNSSGFRNDTDGEGTISFTFNANYTCGTEFIFTDIGGTNDWQAKDAAGNVVGTIVIQSSGDVDGMELGTNGDQLLIYQDPEPTSGDQSTFVCMIQMNNDNSLPIDTDDESSLPTGLGADDIVRFNTEVDNAKYDCTPNIGSASELQAAITNDNGSGGLKSDGSNNWAESNFAISLNTACNFCCGTAISAPTISAPNEVQTNSTFTISITGTLGMGEVWELYTAGCGVGSPLQTTMSNSFSVTAPGSGGNVTYYVRSSEDGTCPTLCASVNVCVVTDLYSLCTVCTANMATCGDCFLPAPYPNPNLDSGCYSIRLIFILDESGSIGGNAGDVEDGVLAFLNALDGQNIEAALIEFSDLARVVNDYTVIDMNYINNIQNYFNGIPYNGQTYFPAGGTNWHDAMKKADAMAFADLILFFTDGEPTGWTQANGTASSCGDWSSTQTPEIVNPVKLANKLKTEGTHMFMLGVGDNIVELNLQRMSGFIEYQTGINDIGTSDYSIGNFDSLANDLEEFVFELCRTDIQVTKEVLGPICDGVVQFRFIVYNLGNESSTNPVYVTDTFPSGYTNLMFNGDPATKICPFNIPCDPPQPPNTFVWTTQPIPPLSSDTLIISATVLSSGNYVNRVWAVAENASLVSDTFPGGPLVEDMPPIITCPANVTIQCNASTLPANTGTPTSSDPDGPPPTLTYSDVSVNGACPVLKIITRTWTATDGCNNTATCVQTIYVRDTTPPIVNCPPNVTVACQTSTLPAVTGSATASDLCDLTLGITYADVTVAGSCPAEFVVHRTWSAVDDCGNVGTCVQNIFVDDDVPPTLICKNVSINCSESTDPSNTGPPIVSNNCGGSSTNTYSDVFVYMSDPPQCSIHRTWIVTDDCGNSTTCEQIIVLVDNSSPSIVCPGNVTISCTASTLPGNTGSATASDNCAIAPAISYTDMITVSPLCVQNYVIARTWKATDECGNSSNCTQSITVRDNIAPAVTCPANVTVACMASTLPASTGTATSSDNCSTPSVTFSDVTVAGICPQERTITRTWRATDACGNSSSCNQTITVDDSAAPSITCPANITIQCTASTLPANTGTATGTDVCSTLSITSTDVIVAGICPEEKTIIRTWRATDACGNSSSCNQTITVDDSAIPSISCPANITIECTASTLPANTGTATGTDNCSTIAFTFTDIIINGGCPQEKTIIRTWKATDACGNFNTCNQTIIVDDSASPAITCPPNVTVQCTASTLPANTGSATATDNCSTISITSTDVIVAGGCPQEKIITRTWRATDACGNLSSCIQTITVDDSTPPTMNCPANVTIQCTASTLPANTGTATATDNCSTLTITSTDIVVDGSCPQEKTITRTWIATDACGNASSCNQIITVDDSTVPALLCPPNITIECTASTLPGNTGTATSTDNCDVSPTVVYSDVITGGSCPQEYTISRTWTTTDDCNNSNTCLQSITIDDSHSPMMSCPANVTIQCTESTLPVETGSATATDNCDSSPNLTFSDNTVSGPADNGYTIHRTWIGTDDCGNSSTCVQNITIENPIDPEIMGSGFDTICSGETEVFLALDQGIGNATYQWNFGSGSSPGTANGIGPHTVTYTYNGTNGTIGANVVLTVSLPGCFSVADTVANIHVNPLPNPAIDGLTTNLCYFRTRTFKPVAAFDPIFTYHWDFGLNASIPPTYGYGPFDVEYSSTGVKTVQLIVISNAQGASCSDTATISFTVISCPGNITGKVKKVDGTGIGGVNVRLYPDNNLDGLPDQVAPVRSVNTVSSGVYSMVGLIPGQYSIVETQPLGYLSVGDQDESNDFDTVVYSHPNDNIIPTTLEASEIDADNNFTETPSPGIITGYVFVDLDNDMLPDNGEGIFDVIISLYHDDDQNGVADPNGFIDSTLTSAIGWYQFGDVPVGNYVLEETQPDGYNSLSDVDFSNDDDVVTNSNSTDDIIPVTIILGETDAENFFIEVQGCGHMITNTNDDGPGSARYVINCSSADDTITFHPFLQGQTIHLNSGRIEIDSNIYIHSDLMPRVSIQSDVSGAFLINAGATVEFKNIDIISGLSGFQGSAFENYGHLIFWDMYIYRNTLLPPGNSLIYNSSAGMITVKGNIQIDDN